MLYSMGLALHESTAQLVLLHQSDREKKQFVMATIHGSHQQSKLTRDILA